MLKLERLAWGIAEIEGWHSPLETNTPGGSRSYRNHNPGNLRRSPFAVGIVDNFAVFRTDFDGFAALMWDIRQKARGNTQTSLTGESTIEDLVQVWAPTSDGNDPEAYITQLSTKTGISRSTKLKDLL
jgi:hypothetical protein